MPAPNLKQDKKTIPVSLMTGNSFGRYPKISKAQTWNMLVSDGALVDYAGFANVFPEPLSANYKGRGIYKSSNGNIIIMVIGAAVYAVDTTLAESIVGVLVSSTGDVFIAENNNHEIVISDQSYLYVYNYVLGTFQRSDTTFPAVAPYFYAPFVKPGYVSFQNGRIIVVELETQNWYLSGINDAKQWDLLDTNNRAYVGGLQTKPDTIQAAVPVPGAGNNLVVFGNTVMELWQDVSTAIFPYQRASTFNVDYGCLNASSIAALDYQIAWLSANEQGGPTVMLFNGGREQSISRDGIDLVFSEITDPTNCTGFLFRQDGHLIYQFTFITDNITYFYDFETKLFFSASDENQNYHPARNVVYFNNDYYFVSLNDGNLYTFGTQFSYLKYADDNIQMMPRVIITPPLRLSSQRPFIAMNLTLTVENGQPNILYPSGTYSEAIDLSLSADGGESFGNSVRNEMNPTGKRLTRMIWQRLGRYNDLTMQIRLIGYGRYIICNDGEMSSYL